MATASDRTATRKAFFKMGIAEAKKNHEFWVHPCALRCLQDIIDDAEGEEESLPLAIELIFVGLAEMKSKEVSKRKKRNVYRADVVKWFAPPTPGEEDKLEWECPADLNEDGNFHGVRKIVGMRVENGKEFYLIGWKPSEEPRGNLSVKLIAAFKKQRRMMVERAFIEAEAEEAGKSKKRHTGSR